MFDLLFGAAVGGFVITFDADISSGATVVVVVEIDAVVDGLAVALIAVPVDFGLLSLVLADGLRGSIWSECDCL